MGGNTTLKKQLRRFWAEESGQTTTEYVLILAIIFVIVRQLQSKLAKGVGDGATQIGDGVTKIINDSMNSN